MSDHRFGAEDFVIAAAAALDLPIAPAHRPGVVANMERLAALSRLVMDFPLPDEVEPASVFRP